MSQELTNAELAKWLRENVVHLFASWAYDGKFDQSFPDNLEAIAARLERMPPPAFAIAWDPSLITPEQYAELVDIIGDMVRANGGVGVRRVAEHDYELRRKGEAK